MDYSLLYSQLKYITPELTVTAASIIAMIVHLFVPKKGHRYAGLICIFGLLAGLVSLLVTPGNSGEIFNGNLQVDQFSFFLKMLFMISGVLTILLCFKFFDTEGYEAGEIYYLLLMSIVGMMFVVSSVDLISFYVSFELFAILSYVLVGIFKKEKRSAEAGIKYFILGTLSSAVMMLGVALIVGLTGETNYVAIGNAIASSLPDANHQLAVLGMVLFLSGLFFKLALVPFHMWTPDVYEGAPTPLVAFLSTAPKAAVFGIMIRVLLNAFPHFEFQWLLVLQVVAIVTMFWGNIAALLQNNIKRMMAYSSIAHAGYITIGLAALAGRQVDAEGAVTGILFYLFAYLFMNVAAFSLILTIQKKSGFGEEIDDMRGFAQRAPMAAAGIIVLLLSLTGIPPTVGFIGKYYIFSSAVGKGLYFLAIMGALNSVISLFYYFRIGKAMFMEAPQEGITLDNSYAKIILIVCCVAILLLGILPSTLTDLARYSFASIL